MPFLEHEQTRLLYVAATRAREQLVISRHAKGTAWGLLNTKLAQVKELKVPASVSIVPPAPAVCSIQAQADANAARIAAEAHVNTPSWSITSVTAEAKALARLAAPAEEADADDGTKVVAQNTPSHRADAGIAWGTLIHGLLEHAMRHPNATRDDLRRLGMWLTVEEAQLRPLLDEALDTVQAVSRAEFWREAKASEHYEEAPFAMAEGTTLTNGVIDLVFRSPDSWQIRDYKTTLALDAAAHIQQLETYRAAMKKVGQDPVAAELVHVRAMES
jgi:ATP-dependent helicase/nuclease subunit A